MGKSSPILISLSCAWAGFATANMPKNCNHAKTKNGRAGFHGHPPLKKLIKAPKDDTCQPVQGRAAPVGRREGRTHVVHGAVFTPAQLHKIAAATNRPTSSIAVNGIATLERRDFAKAGSRGYAAYPEPKLDIAGAAQCTSSTRRRTCQPRRPDERRDIRPALPVRLWDARCGAVGSCSQYGEAR